MQELSPITFYIPKRAEALQKLLLPIFNNWLSQWRCFANDDLEPALALMVSKAEQKPLGDLLSLRFKVNEQLYLSFEKSMLIPLYSLLLGDYDVENLPIKSNLLVKKLLQEAMSDLLINVATALQLAVSTPVQIITSIGGDIKRYQALYECKFGPVSLYLPAKLLPESVPVKRVNSPIVKKVSRKIAIDPEQAQLAVVLSGIKLKISDLANLKPGQVLVTDTLLSQPFELKLGKKMVTQCYLGRKQNNKAIVIVKLIR